MRSKLLASAKQGCLFT